MNSLDELINNYYEKFKGLPNDNPIVRMNQRDDAFELVVLETLYGEIIDVNISEISGSDVNKITKFIVPPPDGGIDIVIENENDDGNTYDFIQVKNSELEPLKIKEALSYMKRTIKSYLKDPSKINDNLKKILVNTSLTNSDDSCNYILVHRGKTNCIKDQDDDEKIITGEELEIIRKAIKKSKIPRVSEEELFFNSNDKFVSYSESQDNSAILLNLRGLELANLAKKHTNTDIGRNILFGYNLREGLSNKSKTYDGMAETIKNEPEKFWFYNNGITIIAEDYIIKSNDKENASSIILKNFSIINGAQTTSALGEFYKKSEINKAYDDIKKLEKVYVLTRILKVTDDTFKSQIAIYNNTQNPITTRDMVSNREEQRLLHQQLLNNPEPNIYMEIRRGMKRPNGIRFYKHQCTSNLELAQLAYAGFKLDPFTARDKKNAFFDTDYKQKEGYLLNKNYHELFYYDPNDSSQGILFKKSKRDIDELLFVHYLYRQTKIDIVKKFKSNIDKFRTQLTNLPSDSDSEFKDNLIKRITFNERMKTIASQCVFYCVAYYYEVKSNFSNNAKELEYNYEDFYNNKVDYSSNLLKMFTDLFLMNTITTIDKLSNSAVNIWIRDKKSRDIFIEHVEKDLQINFDLESKYENYVNSVKQ